MSVIKLDGEMLSAEIKQDLVTRIAALTEQSITPALGTLLVGDDGPSANYVAMKHRDCVELGISSRLVHLPSTASQADVAAVVEDFNADSFLHAYILQYPFPEHLDYEAALISVLPEKDADGLHPINLGKLVQGIEAPLACTPRGIQLLLKRYDIPIAGRHIVIIGRGLTIGRPLANLLSLKHPDANAAITVVHTGVNDIARFTRTADILVAAAGTPHIVKPHMVKPGAAVVAAGVSFVDGKLVSDVDDEVADVAGWLSPRIGGVGPMTRAILMANTVAAAERATS
ncbi:MAG: bifunctional 5,10-methylenetetrahydrofolate dehydrogenase/5,10-methenyltetrahydrofolate cyclohydrolase [Acidimicrobiia bacterium]|nr:bifunctional 5,10-methylenetetrahydrofolate dehydrogenase/5,10-methenyltetrahydrofolate cyclohydrolase [Acidimicrobiia bacterium]MYC58519.1 bifunctional 5,10-methylenetetrahydrofolate dehydrogenase/5,10-methenyltetrahydrofolate cyclohydrolase [Acidimicrobiia bacterium]MYG94277.1 bifunctional 5,10-methylenetetrahydrofolate dehydrogenase/5,10-methenyltetrahydrofolate cyclohydrolase [Acidimicrobiia bacterium]MYI30375.1 bifunctional 5,10-methylenetetrahydrofolate dehydrogenase/5,10-methenyltetrah